MRYFSKNIGVIFFMLFCSSLVHAEGMLWETHSKNAEIQERVKKIMNSYSNEDLAGAVLMPSFEKNMKPASFGKMLCALHIQSYILLRSDTSKQLVESIQNAYDRACPLRPVTLKVALDAEPSLMKYRMPNVSVQNTNALKNDEDVINAARKISSALLDAGIIINFAPIYDVGNNKAIINDRAFGDSQHVDDLVRRANLFTSTSSDQGVIPTAKHFPGHGLVKNDSHKQLVTIQGEPKEIPQFIKAIESGVPMVMVGHIAIAGGEYDTKGLPSTLSKKIMTDLLKNKLGFKGVVVTDSMAMGALKGQQNRTTRSLEAGADIILIPPYPKDAYEAVLKKIKTDKVFAERVSDAVRKITTMYITRESLAKK